MSMYIASNSDFFLDRVEEKDPYYNFLKVHLRKEHGKGGKWRPPTVPPLFPYLSMMLCEMRKL